MKEYRAFTFILNNHIEGQRTILAPTLKEAYRRYAEWEMQHYEQMEQRKFEIALDDIIWALQHPKSGWRVYETRVLM